jgi:hypothetical protein
MEPRRTMKAHAASATTAALVGVWMGVPALALVVGAVVAGLGGGLYFNYLRWCRTLKRPSSRPALDPVVLREWTIMAAVTAGAAVVSHRTGFHPLRESPLVTKVFVVCFTTASAAVFISGLIDWYWILPRVSGVVCEAPCEVSGDERWTSLTNHWIFHRLATEFIVSAAIVAFPTAMATGASSSAQPYWNVAAVVVTASIAYREKFVVPAALNAGDARTKVGDVVRVRHESDEEIRWSWAYVVDVSIRGAKVLVLDGLTYTGEPFDRKADYLLASDEALAAARRASDAALCRFDRGVCRGVNWYCRENEAAHGPILDAPIGEALIPEPPRPAAPARDDDPTERAMRKQRANSVRLIAERLWRR